jgi:DNA-binding GntR family transcriptional regulator
MTEIAARPSLALNAYEELKSAILDGRLPPGTALTESSVAETLSVSRTPTRYALRRLEAERFLDRDERGRLVVHRLTETELRELFDLRGLLEGHAARLASRRISDAELERLSELLAEDRRALKADDVRRLAELNEAIHGIVREASRNHALVEVLGEIRSRVFGFGFSAFAVGERRERRSFVEEHVAIVRALRDGDGDLAAELTLHHTEAALELLLARFSEYEAGGQGR